MTRTVVRVVCSALLIGGVEGCAAGARSDEPDPGRPSDRTINIGQGDESTDGPGDVTEGASADDLVERLCRRLKSTEETYNGGWMWGPVTYHDIDMAERAESLDPSLGADGGGGRYFSANLRWVLEASSLNAATNVVEVCAPVSGLHDIG
jgi:hypothetical protein